MGNEHLRDELKAGVDRRRFLIVTGAAAGLLALRPLPERAVEAAAQSDGAGRSWLAGDHHIHSEFSVGLDQSTSPPTQIVKGDAVYAISLNAEMARRYGLHWAVCTDHGGPNHAKLNLERAYPELLRSRIVVPEVLQFWGMEMNPPGGDHATLMIPNTDGEQQMLFDLESRYDRNEPFPVDPARNNEALMLEALRAMQGYPARPLVIAHHVSRSATGLRQYGLYTPGEFRNWHDTAPDIAIGFEGSPGHQAAALFPDGRPGRTEAGRGAYSNYPTHGGFDQMTAIVGGAWDSLLGEGRRWWITATSDSHVNYREGNGEIDFWPGEYSKTYVWAAKDHADVMDGLRSGRMFVTLGDLVTALDVYALGPNAVAGIGGTLTTPRGSDLTVTIRFRPLAGENPRGESPKVRRVDLIAGDVTGPAADRGSDTNPTTRVVRRFTERDWRREGDFLTITHGLGRVDRNLYLRVRGTNTDVEEPGPDARGLDPWQDLWFYSNPIFVEVG